MSRTLYTDPAGNITAIVRGAAREDRTAVAKSILLAQKAEQVGFETEPMFGGCARLEMMGGEFCGNATRAFAYLKASEQWKNGEHDLCVEISGAEKPISVHVDLDCGTAYAQMPMPLECRAAEVEGAVYPVVMMEGICHLIAQEKEPSVDFVEKALRAMEPLGQEACGVMFLRGDSLTPAVFVRETQSLVWESSCGSGSVACGWYLAKQADVPASGEMRYRFSEPGGIIETSFSAQGSGFVSCCMGGLVALSEWEER